MHVLSLLGFTLTVSVALYSAKPLLPRDEHSTFDPAHHTDRATALKWGPWGPGNRPKGQSKKFKYLVEGCSTVFPGEVQWHYLDKNKKEVPSEKWTSRECKPGYECKSTGTGINQVVDCVPIRPPTPPSRRPPTPPPAYSPPTRPLTPPPPAYSS